MRENLQGVYAVVVTPFTKEGAFDVVSAKKHLDWLYANGIQGVCILGATGEYQSVTNEEHKQYLGAILPYIRDRMSVLVGVSRERPDDVIDLMNAAQQLGAEASMILSPFYCHPCQQEIVENYRYIASMSTLPIIIYNNPGSAGVDIDRQTMCELFALDNVAILKESTGNIRRLTEAVTDAPEAVGVFCGCDNLALESLIMGAKGWISMAANFAPRDCQALYEAAKNQELEQAKAIYRRLLPALNLLENATKPAATIKYILSRHRNVFAGYMRRPRLDLTCEEQAQVDAQVDFTAIS